MKVLLVQPAATDRGFIHLGIGFIAASLEARGHNVRILDLGVEGEAKSTIMKLIREISPEVIGITALTPTYPGAIRVAGIVKELFPERPVILGGTHPSVLTDDVLNEPVVDIVVKGEGEITMAELLEAMEQGRDFSDVQGISYKSNGKVIHNPPRAFISNIDDLPSPPWHLFSLDKYTGNLNGKKAVGLSATRGCPFNCVFCYRGPAAGKSIRYWSPERVIAEIKNIKNTYGITGIHFWNDVFTYDKKWAETFCDLLIKEDLGVEWDCQTRADLIDENILTKMKESGCTAVMLGVESGSDQILEHMEKGLTKEKIRDAFALLHASGLETTATFTIGLPWDTKETVQETIDFAKEINPDFAMFYLATPFPGSELWSMCTEKGIELSRDWANYRILPFEVKIDNIIPVFDTSKLSVEDLGKFIKTAQIEFQLGRLRKGQALRGLKNIIDIFRLLFRRSRSVSKVAKLFLRVFMDMILFVKVKFMSLFRKPSM